MKISRFVMISVIFMYLMIPFAAFAETIYSPNPAYVHTSTPNSTATQPDYLDAGDGAVVVSAEVKYLVQSGDLVKIKWYTETGSLISTDNLAMSGSPETVSPPSNAHAAQLVLVTGSASGDRWAWWHSSTNNTTGNTTIFPDPDTGGSSGDDGGTVDLTPVVSALEVIQGQLNDLINNSSSSGGQLGDLLSAIQDQTGVISSKFDEVTGKLTNIQGQLNTMDSHIVDIYDYFSTPRAAQPMSVNMPQMFVDSTPPPVEEPYQQPYVYNRPTQQFEMAPFVDSPGPLSIAPDPVTMQHDPPAVVDQPKQINQPLQPDPVNLDSPREPDPVSVDPPRTQDPPSREEPLQLTPVNLDAPLTPQQPITRNDPISRDTPLTPAAPLAPDPPL